MELRAARAEEIRSVAELWMHTFPGEGSLAERMATLETGGLHGGIETVRVAVTADRIAGALKAIPFTQHIRGSRMRMMGLAAVGVAPHARRSGVAAALCREALSVARERGDVVSALDPFRPAFYHRLGWALAGELHSFRFAPEALPEAAGEIDVRLAGQSELPGLRDCYAAVARRSNGLLERDEAMWERHLKPADTFTFVTGYPVSGYMIVRYGIGRPSLRALYIRELVAADAESYARLLRWIPRQRDLWRRARYDAMPDEHFGLLLADPRPPAYRPARWLWSETARILRGPMVRILDVEKALELREDWSAGSPFAFTLVVTDRELAANNGPWLVEFDGARLGVRPSPGAVKGSTRLTVDIATLSQLFVGELDVRSAMRLGGARVDGEIERVVELFGPAKGFRLLDEF